MSDPKNPQVDNGQTSSGGNSAAPSNALAAVLAGSHQSQQQQGFASVDSNTALMMTNAAASIAALAAQAMQQMAGQQPQQQAPVPSVFPASLYAALQGGGHNNPLLSAAVNAPPSAASTHAALLAALSGSTQRPAATLSGLFAGNNDAATAALLCQTGAVLQQPPPSVSMSSPGILPGMQSWSTEKLEQHVAMMQRNNQNVPQAVALLLAEAQRKEKKKNAKRVANRKSASTSRARKKALVEEMTKTNARLKRQALILSLLPDLVITTTPEGEITFCSAQVERILQYRPEDLVGAKLYELVVPASREALKCLTEELTHPGKAKAARAASSSAKARRGSKRRLPVQGTSGVEAGAIKGLEDNANGNSSGSVLVSSGSGDPSAKAGAAVVSDRSFPLSVVEVESKQPGKNPKSSASNENLDTLTSNSGASGEDDSGDANPNPKKDESKKRPRSDDSSSLSSDVKNLRANDNLDRNVRWHNQRMLHSNTKELPGPKDDVTGASVTANNAGARLSSLKHVPEQKKDEKDSRYENNGDQSSSDDSLLAGVEEKKKGENASDDSGYRESNDSREETSSSGSDTSQSNDRRTKYMAPTVRMCLIRDDLTTLWCEVTSSIRDRAQDEEASEDKTTSNSSDGNDTTESKPEQKELLLCLRPIRDGEKTVDESLRFCPSTRNMTLLTEQASHEPTVSSTSADDTYRASYSDPNKPSSRPPKKRALAANEMDSCSTNEEVPRKKRSKGQSSSSADDTEKSVVESLLKMNKASQ